MPIHFFQQFIYSKINRWHWEILPPVKNITGYVNCCGTTLSIARIPTCFTSKPGILPSRRLSDRVVMYLSSALEPRAKTNGERQFRSTHSGKNLKSHEILWISYTKNTSCSKFNCHTLGRVLRLNYLTSFVRGKCCNVFVVQQRCSKKAVLSSGSLFSLMSFIIQRSERLSFFYREDNSNHHLKGCLGKPASLD